MRRLALLAAVAAAPGWSAVDLGTPPGQPDAFVHAVGVNAHGAVIAESTTGVGGPGARQQSFLWRHGRLSVLRYGTARDVGVSAIDERGDVVGEAGTAAVLWRDGRATLLGRGVGDPVALDASDEVIGEDRGRAWIWRNGTLTALGTLGGDSATANAIDDRGRVVGVSDVVAGRTSHAFLWRDGTMTDLGGLGDLDTTAVAIGDGGTVVGFASDHAGDGRVAVEWRSGKLVDLGTFGAPHAEARAVDAAGDVLVQTETADGDPRGIRLLRAGRVLTVAVPALSGPLVATGLDRRGGVIGWGSARDGGRRTFVWRDGRTWLLPTSDGAGPPWGGPTQIDGDYAAGDEYVALKGADDTSHAVLWHLGGAR